MAADHADAAASADAGPRTAGPRPAWLEAWPRGARSASLCLALMLLASVLVGGPLLAAGKVGLFFVGWVLLPGLACAALLQREDDELLSAGMGLALGTVLLGLLVFLCRATGSFGALWAWPLSTLGFWALLRRRAPATAAGAAASGGAWLFALVAVVVLVRVPTALPGPVDGWYLQFKDLVFHGGNAAELLKDGPLLDPRVAGRPLNYHLLSHALVAGMSVVTGESIADLFRFWFLGFYPLLLALLVFALARELGRSALAGLAAALALVLHNDLGLGLLGDDKGAVLGFTSHLDLGLFVSPTTSLGLALLVAQAVVLLRGCDPARRVGAHGVVLLALLALGASMAKGSVMPVAVAGAFFACGVEALRTRRVSARALGAALVLLFASLPATLYLSLGPGSYAGAMFRFSPWSSALTSKSGIALLERLPFLERHAAGLGGFLLTLPWLPGFLGLGGLGALAWLAAGRPSLGGLGAWILGVVLAGLGAGVLLLAPGVSQLFFAYDAQVLLAIPAGVGALRLWERRRRLALALALCALPFLAGGVGGIARSLHERVRVAGLEKTLWPKWCEGAAWLRQNTPHDALLVAADDGLMLTMYAERRVALAGARYTPEAHAMRWKKENGRWQFGGSTTAPFAELERACDVMMRRGDGRALTELRESSGHAGELYLVRDQFSMPQSIEELEIAPLPRQTTLDTSPLLETCFRNEAMAVFRVKEGSGEALEFRPKMPGRAGRGKGIKRGSEELDSRAR